MQFISVRELAALRGRAPEPLYTPFSGFAPSRARSLLPFADVLVMMRRRLWAALFRSIRIFSISSVFAAPTSELGAIAAPASTRHVHRRDVRVMCCSCGSETSRSFRQANGWQTDTTDEPGAFSVSYPLYRFAIRWHSSLHAGTFPGTVVCARVRASHGRPA